MVEQRRNELLQRKSAVTVHQTLSVLRAILNYAKQNFENSGGRAAISENPVRNLKRIPESNYRRTFIEDTKLPSWFSALQTEEWITSRDYLLFLLLSGLRMREAMKLKWSDIDFEQAMILMRSEVCKNRHAYCLPLSTFLKDFLLRRKAICASDSAYVFPGKNGRGHLSSCQRIVDRICMKIRNKFILNDIRRTFIFAALKGGVSAHLVRKLINSINSRDCLEGIEVDMEELRAAMETITQRLLKVLTCNSGDAAQDLPDSTIDIMA